MTMPDRLRIHATTVALGDVAAVIRGPSGAGKSDLALRFLSAQGHWPAEDRPRRLIADDQTLLTRREDALIASAPSSLAGLIEVRGVGIISLPTAPEARVRLIVDLVASADVERLPETETKTQLLGQSISLRRLAPFEASAPLKLLWLLRTATAAISD